MGEETMQNVNVTVGTISTTGTAVGTISTTGTAAGTASVTLSDIGEAVVESMIRFHPTATEEFSFTCTIPEFHPEWNCKPNGYKNYNPLMCFGSREPAIVNIDIIVPNKVVEVTIFDGQTYKFKQICREPDVFDLKFALALAWAKYRQTSMPARYQLTTAGIEYVAKLYMTNYKQAIKEFDRAIKAYHKWEKERDKAAAEEEERKAVIARRQEKNRKRREKARQREKEQEISLIAEAIKRSKEA